jgi:alanine racemase
VPDSPAPRARIADVAREAGVSKAAVSFAFNSPERLKPQTAERIRQVATALGYRPHPVARMLTARSTATIGIVTPIPLTEAFANPFFALFAEGVSAVTEDRDLSLLFISPVRGSLERAMARATVDGIIVIGLDERHPEVESIRRSGLPTILVDTSPWPEHGAVATDDMAGAHAAARHLLDLGHRDVLIVSIGPTDEAAGGVVARRMQGYRMAFDESGVSLPEVNVRQTQATFEGGEAALLGAWRDGLRPTAVLSMSDAAAAGVLQGARHLGLRTPDDLSVIGFDDLPLTRFTDPPLTTVHQPVRHKGEEAARMLVDALKPADGDAARARDSARTVEHKVLETQLVVRQSTAAPRSAGMVKG